MAREDGSVNGQLEAWLRVQATGGETLECLIDTGFNGALVLPRAEAVRLNLTVLGRVPIIGWGV
jgi:predicted aspartyl protease